MQSTGSHELDTTERLNSNNTRGVELTAVAVCKCRAWGVTRVHPNESLSPPPPDGLCSRQKSVRSPHPAAASHTLRVSEALAGHRVQNRGCDLASRVLVRGADPSSGEPGWFEGAVTWFLRSGPGGGGLGRSPSSMERLLSAGWLVWATLTQGGLPAGPDLRRLRLPGLFL